MSRYICTLAGWVWLSVIGDVLAREPAPVTRRTEPRHIPCVFALQAERTAPPVSHGVNAVSHVATADDDRSSLVQGAGATVVDLQLLSCGRTASVFYLLSVLWNDTRWCDSMYCVKLSTVCWFSCRTLDARVHTAGVPWVTERDGRQGTGSEVAILLPPSPIVSQHCRRS